MATPSRIRKPYDPHRRVKQHIGETSRVQQHLGSETDINNIMSKYQSTGILTHVNSRAQQYGDFSGVSDFKSSLEQVMEAEALFMELSAKVRDRFGNNPAKFLEFATDPSNLEEMRKLGLAPPAEAKPQPGPVQEGPTGAPTTRKEAPPGAVPPSSTTPPKAGNDPA